MDPSTRTLLIGLVLVLALWYLGASIFNRRRGLAVFHWLRNGLNRLGGEIASSWIGSSGSGARIQVRKADPPFRDFEIIYLLASRELLPLFLFDLLRGKRDQLILKARFRAAVHGEVEVVPAGGGLARKLRAEQERPWNIETGPHGLLIGTRGRKPEEPRAALAPLLEKYGPHVRQVSLSSKAPHLILILSLSGLYEKGGSAAGLFDDVAAVASTEDQDG